VKANEYRGPDSHRVKQMFAGIAHRYDFLNHFLSVSIDRNWRKIAVDKIRELAMPSSGSSFLDVCSGTGDVAIALHRAFGNKVIAADFCHPMLTRANTKIVAAGIARHVQSIEADTLSLPFRDHTFDVVTIAFGLRNLEDPALGLAEIHRLLRQGGLAVILEFSQPVVPVFRQVFGFYFRHILPGVGAAISGNADAYRYLPDSVAKFPGQEELMRFMKTAGFQNVGYRNLTMGIAALHWGQK
jgi:demethylmenaquinone methyltransferase/2-methoxy-6-polyprenyl-1,4-benzoquinol methylase